MDENLYAPPKARKRRKRVEEPGLALRATGTLGLVTLVLLGAQLGLQWIVHGLDLAVLSDIEAHTVSPTVVQVEQLLLYAGSAARIGGIVVFLVWIHRAAANARALRGSQMTTTPGWAVGSFFIPVGMLWLPYRSMADIVRNSDPSSNGITPPVVIAWWLTFIGSNLSRNLHSLSQDVGARIGLAALTTAGLSIALVLLGTIIRRIESGQRALAKLPRAADEPSLPSTF